MGLGYICFWIIVTLYIFSVSSPTTQPMPSAFNPIFPGVANYTSYTWNSDMQNAFIAHFFHLLWNTQFLIYFCYFVIAGAVANWYFTPRDNSGEKRRGSGDNELEANPICTNCMRTCRFHLGTICFGSLIIAIIMFLRAVVHYIEEKTKVDTPNVVQRAIFCLIQCCLKCVECCCDKLSKNAFVWTAIYGDSFIPAACSSFGLVWSNLARLAAVNMVGDFLLFLGRVLVALFTTGLVAIILNDYYLDQISSLVMPCVVVFLVAYLVAALFMSIFDVTIDTIFLCFLIDERFNKINGQMLAPQSLIDLIDAHAEESREISNNLKRPAPGMPVATDSGYQALY